MSYESTAQPIKIGYLFDFLLPEFYPQEMRDDLIRPFELVFNDGLRQRVIDRPVQVVYREVEGLPKGTAKAVIDAYGELVDEGCLVVFGPHITENAVPTREAIEERLRVPAINVCGSDDWLGEWTFAFPQGSMTDEPIFWADLLTKGGHTEVGVLVEQSLVGESYLKNLRNACRCKGIRVVAEAQVAQTAQDVGAAIRSLHEAKPTAVVHCTGFAVIKWTKTATSVACPWPYPEAKVYDPQGFYERNGQPGPYSAGIWSTWMSAQPHGRPDVQLPADGGRCTAGHV
ncbi:ABC transporter substrate-binding protein [Mycobacterium lacus]|uniref:Leucine-binding protein domain-containing protein n=1 Tax=Mycobacterium lacus TaxID=169765 RepID=A0A7I7NGJ2_9MYCO|nr:ABC transporter substrate-binding protein [Mycobacterium lacus]MCV7123776.1 ABC transporter substrate-binding protein [Mycobacterium lacus]BBX95433.1 hypothetical protein MLAC_07270 [Mycobacterium lacus]